jgi:TPR repeat protein
MGSLTVQRHAFMLVAVVAGVVTGCAGMNPNPGERTADYHMFTRDQDCRKALDIARPRAERGEPWAELRLGFGYMTGCGIEKNDAEAVKWLHLAAKHEAKGGWATGRTVAVIGRPGYFNQNSDALVAQVLLAELYLDGRGVAADPVTSYLYARNVKEKSGGRELFFCCQWLSNGGWVFAQPAIQEQLAKAEAAMSPEQKAEAEVRWESWKP